MGINTKLWGPAYWETLFWAAANATDNRRKLVFRKLVAVFAAPDGGLPCEECNLHFTQMVRTPGYTVDEFISTNQALVYLVWKWKSEVNARLRKRNLPWHEVRAIYLSSDATSCQGACTAV